MTLRHAPANARHNPGDAAIRDQSPQAIKPLPSLPPVISAPDHTPADQQFAWTNGYRAGWHEGCRSAMAHCLATLQPLLDEDADLPVIREALQALENQMPEPRPRG